jgi:hypothetical protein
VISFKPGDVCVATVRGVPNVRVFHYEYDGVRGWCSDEQVEGETDHAEYVVTDIRPLVVLDLDAGEVAGLVDVLNRSADGMASVHPGLSGKVARQIEQQTKPPRIPEPGLWGVVSVERPDGLTDYYTCGPGGWFSERGEHFNWESLPGTPALIRPGIEDES